MPARINLRSYFSRVVRTKSVFWIVALVAVIAVVTVRASANNVQAAATSSPTGTALTPAIKLAIGTADLEGTDQAVDSISAAKLLPLWQLLEELSTSDAAAPQEITAVVEEIRLNMTAAQIKAIDAMSIEQAALAGSSNAATTTGTQAASANAGPIMGAVMAGGGPMDGGGPMPQAGSSQSSSTAKTAASVTSAAIKRVIQLLESKVQS